jgi:ATP-dependent RNA helicase DDX27
MYMQLHVMCRQVTFRVANKLLTLGTVRSSPCPAGVSTSHQKKKRKTGGAAAGDAAAGVDGQGGLFSGDGTGKGSGSGTAGGSKGRSSSGGSSAKGKSLSKTDLNRLKRGGKGKSSFKSKKKFKRR